MHIMSDLNTFYFIGACFSFVFLVVSIWLSISLSKQKKETEIAKKQLEEAMKSFVREKQELIDAHNQEIDSLRKDCKLQIQHIKENIENKKEVLLRTNEKDLLVQVMLSLSGYASRLDRIEMSIAEVLTDEKTSQAVNNYTCKLGQVSADFSKLIDSLATMVSSSVGEVNNSVLSSLDGISHKIDSSFNKTEVSTKINALLSSVDSIDDRTRTLYSRIGEYGVLSIDDRLNDLEMMIRNAIDVAESAKYAAESARDAIENN